MPPTEDPMSLASVLHTAPDDEDHSSDYGSEEDSEGGDYQQIRDAPSPPHQDTSLYDAIHDAPILEVRRLLVQLTDSNPSARETVTSKLLRPSVNGRKRKAFEQYINCKNDYSTGENTVGSCVYHEGAREVDDESLTWDDHEPDVHGDPHDPDLMDDSTY